MVCVRKIEQIKYEFDIFSFAFLFLGKHSTFFFWYLVWDFAVKL